MERFYHGRHKDVFFHLALRAIKTFGLECAQIHQDTTTVTFTGQYAGWQAPEELTHGHNKDHRPDLKQLVLGIIGDGGRFGAPGASSLSAAIKPMIACTWRTISACAGCSSAPTSSMWRIANWPREKTFAALAGCGGRFVSVMPRTRKEDSSFRQRVATKPSPSGFTCFPGKTTAGPTPKSTATIWPKANTGPTATACCGFAAPRKPSRTPKREPGTSPRAWTPSGNYRPIEHLPPQSQPAIEQALENILDDHHTQDWIGYQIQVHRQYEKHFPKRGRPKGCQKGQWKWKPYFSVSFKVDRQALEQEALTDGVFPLITNLEAAGYRAKRVLEIYKFQPFLEKRHSQLKTWQEVTPVLLKKDERVVAYLHMHVMALMVATLIERQLRRAMHQRSLPALPLYPENRPCRYPTLFDIVRVFRQVERYEVVDGERVTLFPAKLNRLQHQLLELLEVPPSLYQ